MRTLKPIALFAIAIALFPSGNVRAVTVDNLNTAQIGLTPNFTPGTPYEDIKNGTGPQFVGGGTTGGANTLIDGSAYADYGILKNFVSAYGSGVAVTRSTFRDKITITSPSVPNGTLGTLTFSVYVNGLLQATSGSSYASYSVAGDMAGGFYDLSVSGQLNSPSLPNAGFVGNPPGNTYTSVPVSFVYGQAMPMSIELAVSAVVGYDNVNAGSATGNFLNTLLWNGIGNVTANGSAVANFSVTSVSGTNWANAIADVPEPASLALLALGVLPLFARRSRR